MAQLALYRKYRSQTFEDLIGQEHVVKTLQNGLNTGRIAQTFLFTGPRGTGKTSSARLLAKALNCEKGPSGTPCNECEQCLTITTGTHPDVIEMDAASESGVEEVREKIVEMVAYAPMIGRYKVFIIDEVHDLSGKAFDALLKTVEEPPPHLVFVLATTEFNKVPATIRSRCQKYEFHRATMQNLVDRLNFVCTSEGVQAEPQALSAIARMADGGYRDALTLLEQAILVSDGLLTLDIVYDQLGLVSEQTVDELLLAMQGKDVGRVIELLDTVIRSGRDPRSLLESMMHRLADLTRIVYQVPESGNDATRESSMHDIAVRLGKDFLVDVRREIANAHRLIRDISLPRLWLESELMRLTVGGTIQAVAQPQAKREPVAAPAKPTPRAVVQPQAEEVVQKVTPVSEPEPDPVEAIPQPAPRDIWQSIVQNIPLNPKTGGASPHALKLRGSELIEDKGDRLVVSVSEMIKVWFEEKPDRIQFLTSIVSSLGRTGTTIEFVTEKKNSPKLEDNQAVELPVDGARLERLVREVFNLTGANEEDNN